jgi:3-hydroxyacyl-CoA dehydrogenase/enoyl-CoA hydratase/3-hydroxybutyryl-CoA epimerase
LSEGVTTVADANLESIFGLGFPAWSGGALQFIYGQGVDAFQRRCEELAERYGAGFVVTPEVINALEQHHPVY